MKEETLYFNLSKFITLLYCSNFAMINYFYFKKKEELPKELKASIKILKYST